MTTKIKTANSKSARKMDKFQHAVFTALVSATIHAKRLETGGYTERVGGNHDRTRKVAMH